MFKKQKKAQKWFDDKHSKEDEDISINDEDIHIHNLLGKKKDLIGSLNIEDFTKLKSISLKKLKLTSLEIINCSQLSKIDLSELATLKSLFVSNCPRLTELDCSHGQSELTELDISISNLVKLDCSNTSVEKLSLNLCPNIKKLNCSNNNKLISLDISNCFKLEYLDCSNSRLTSIDLSNCPESITVNPPNLKEKWKKEKKGKDKIRNLLVVGRTGVGKSALSNVLSESDIFGESGYSVSETKNFQKGVFEWKGIKYCVVDTIGIDNTRSSIEKALDRIAEGIYSMPDGISQVLIVVDERFVTDEIGIEPFKDFILSTDIPKYLTVVRTRFPNFTSNDECEKDKNQLYEESETIAEIIGLSNGIVYVDNPPINIFSDDDGDDHEVRIKLNKKSRAKSRKILLNHLEKVCKDSEYKVRDKWDDLRSKIVSLIPF